MNRLSLVLLCGVVAVASPALAEKSDRAFVEQMRDQIIAARSEPGVARAGAAELAAAERRLPDLAKAMDDNEVQDARAAYAINASRSASANLASPKLISDTDILASRIANVGLQCPGRT